MTGWFTLRRMLDEQADARLVLDRLEKAAADWKRLGESRDETVWSAAQIAETARLDVEFLGAGEREFLDASRRSRQKGAGRVLLLVPVVLASICGAAAMKARRELDARLAAYRGGVALAEAERMAETDDVERRCLRLKPPAAGGRRAAVGGDPPGADGAQRRNTARPPRKSRPRSRWTSIAPRCRAPFERSSRASSICASSCGGAGTSRPSPRAGAAPEGPRRRGGVPPEARRAREARAPSEPAGPAG